MSSTPWSLKSSIVKSAISLHPSLLPVPPVNSGEPTKKPTTRLEWVSLPVVTLPSGGPRGEGTVTISYQPGGLPVPLGSLLRQRTLDRIMNIAPKAGNIAGFRGWNNAKIPPAEKFGVTECPAGYRWRIWRKRDARERNRQRRGGGAPPGEARAHLRGGQPAEHRLEHRPGPEPVGSAPGLHLSGRAVEGQGGGAGEGAPRSGTSP